MIRATPGTNWTIKRSGDGVLLLGVFLQCLHPHRHRHRVGLFEVVEGIEIEDEEREAQAEGFVGDGVRAAGLMSIRADVARHLERNGLLVAPGDFQRNLCPTLQSPVSRNWPFRCVNTHLPISCIKFR